MIHFEDVSGIICEAVLPLVKLLGIGLGFSLYHFQNMIVGAEWCKIFEGFWFWRKIGISRSQMIMIRRNFQDLLGGESPSGSQISNSNLLPRKLICPMVVQLL